MVVSILWLEYGGSKYILARVWWSSQSLKENVRRHNIQNTVICRENPPECILSDTCIASVLFRRSLQPAKSGVFCIHLLHLPHLPDLLIYSSTHLPHLLITCLVLLSSHLQAPQLHGPAHERDTSPLPLQVLPRDAFSPAYSPFSLHTPLIYHV